jgi:hypothetical protein
VLLSNGAEATVGTGCARGESAEVVHALTLGASRAKRAARILAELAQARAKLAAFDRAAAKVALLEAPAVVEFSIERSDPRAIALGLPPIPAIAIGNATRWHRTIATASREDLEELEYCWRVRETSARAGMSSRPSALVSILEKSLAKAQVPA